MSFRWYGKTDPVTLEYISQIPGMNSIVSAVYDVKPGEVWPEEAIKEVGMVVEGINALPAAIALAKAYEVEMPITETAYDIVFNGVAPKDGVLKLMMRDKKPEAENVVKK